MKNLKVGNYAFWPYDFFPYFLCGTITKINKSNDYPGKNYVLTEQYGVGHWFKPAFCVPAKDGIKIKEKIEELKERLTRETRLLRSKYLSLLIAQMPLEAQKIIELHE